MVSPLEQAKRDRDRRKKHILNINKTRPDPRFTPLDPDGPASVIQRDPNRGTNRINTPDGGTAQAPQINNSSITNPVDYDSDSNTTDQRPHTPTVPLEEIVPPGAELPFIKILFGAFDLEDQILDFAVGGDRDAPSLILNRTDWKEFLPQGQYDNAESAVLSNVGVHLDSWGQEQSEWIVSIGSVFDVVRPPLFSERAGVVESVAIHDVIQGDVPDEGAGQPFNATIQTALAGRDGIPENAPDGVTDEIEHQLKAYPQGWAEYRYNAQSGEDDPCCVGYEYDYINGEPNLNLPIDRRPGWVAKLTGQNLNEEVIQVWTRSSGQKGKSFGHPDLSGDTCTYTYESSNTVTLRCDCSVGGVIGLRGRVTGNAFAATSGPQSKCDYSGVYDDSWNWPLDITINGQRHPSGFVINTANGQAQALSLEVWWPPGYDPGFNPYQVNAGIRAYKTEDPAGLEAFFSSQSFRNSGEGTTLRYVVTNAYETCSDYGFPSWFNPPPPPGGDWYQDVCQVPSIASSSDWGEWKKVLEVSMRDIENGLRCGSTWQGETVNMCNSPIIPLNESWCADAHRLAKPFFAIIPYPLVLPRDKEQKPVWKPELNPFRSGFGLPGTFDYDNRVKFPYQGLWEITSMDFVWCGEPDVDKFIEGWQDGQTVYAAPPEENPRPLHLPYAQATTHENPWQVVTSNPEVDRTLMKRGNDYGVVLAGGQPVALTLGDGVKALLDANPLGISWERISDRLWVVEADTFDDPDWAKSDGQTTVTVTGLLLDVAALTLDIEGQITALAIGPAMTDDQEIFSYSFHPEGLNG